MAFCRSLNPYLPVVFVDANQENGNYRLKTPELPTTKALQKRKAETEGEIKGVKSPQSAAASHNKLSINVLMNTPSHPLHIAAGELHCEPTGSKKKGK